MATRVQSLKEGIECSFEEEWPELARYLERFLAAKGVEQWLRADVIQETAARLYPRWETLDHSQPLWNLVATIAVRVTHNHRRKESRVELVAEPNPIHQDDVELRGFQRAQLDKTRSALRQLTADQRQVLLAEVGEAAPPGGSRSRIKVLRLRARAKLREQLGPWAPSGVAIKLSHLRSRIAEKTATMDLCLPVTANSFVTAITAATLAIGGIAVGTGDATAVRAGTSVPIEQTRVLSSAKLRDSDLDPKASIRRRTPGVSRAKARSNSTHDGDAEWIDNTMDEVNGQGKTVDDQGKTVDDQGKKVDEQEETVAELEKEVEDQEDELEDL